MGVIGKRVVLIFLVVLFLSPVLISFVLHYIASDWAPWGTVNKGELIVPLRPLPIGTLTLQTDDVVSPTRTTWTVMVVVQGECDKDCWQRLSELRQIQKAMNKDAERIRRLLVSLLGPWSDDAIKEFQIRLPGLVVGHMSAEGSKLLAIEPEKLRSGLYLVDPRRNLMMVYRDRQPGKDVYDDLRRLLKSSRAG